MMQITEIIRQYLGWCPIAHTLPQRLPVPEHDAIIGAPSQGAGMPAGTRWLNRYRNRVFLQALFYTFAFIFFVPFFYAVDPTRPMMFFGIIAGLVIFAATGRRLWDGFDLALTKDQDIRTGPEGYVILFLVVGIILAGAILLVMASLSIIPLETALELPAGAVGFAFIPWYVLLLILLWERRRGYILLFDKKTISFTAERCVGG
jgi:hypothetical protein